MKNLLVCGAGAGMEQSLSLLRDIVDQIIVVTDRPFDAAPFADKVIEAYPRDEHKVLAAMTAAIGLPEISGVFSLGYENPRVIARLTEWFRTPGLSYEVMETSALKEKRIQALSSAGIAVPAFIVAQGKENTLKAIGQIGYPCIIKPNDQTSSIGVSLIATEADRDKLVQHALDHSETKTVVVESFLIGTEHTVEGLFADGQMYATGFSDRNYEDKHRFAPFIFENGDNLPSALPANKKEQVIEIAKEAARALGYRDTAFHGDFMFSSAGQVIVLELTPRLSGSRFGTELVPLSTGVNVLRNAVRLCLGEKINLSELIETVNPPRSVVARFLPSTGGIIQHVGDLSTLKNRGEIYDINWEMDITPGKEMKPYQSGKDMIAGVIAVGNSFKEAEGKVLNALTSLPIEIMAAD